MKARKYRIYLNSEQKVFIVKTFDYILKVYGLVWMDKIKHYESKESISIKCRSPAPVQYYKIECSFLTEADGLVFFNIQYFKQTYRKFFLGLIQYLIDNLGNKVCHSRHLKLSLDRLGIEQRKFSRKRQKSNNKDKQRIILTKHYERTSNSLNDFLQKRSSKLAHDDQITGFAIENLSFKGMIKNKRLSFRIVDSGWYELIITHLRHKCKELGKNMINLGVCRRYYDIHGKLPCC
ncbi:MAG: transposase [Neisseriaceae bacterium]|nr:MAG: transposase [Neisseriaceae bacterium]